MLYLRLVMDHIFVLCSNSLSDAEEPPCSVTLIRWSKSSPISFYLDLYGEESRWWDDKELEEEEEREIGRLAWLTSVAGGPRIYSDLCQTVLEQTTELLRDDCRYQQLNTLSPLVCRCAKLSLFVWTVPELVVCFLCGRLPYCALHTWLKKEQVLSNCKALKVTMCVWKMGYGASFISALNCNL